MFFRFFSLVFLCIIEPWTIYIDLSMHAITSFNWFLIIHAMFLLAMIHLHTSLHMIRACRLLQISSQRFNNKFTINGTICLARVLWTGQAVKQKTPIYHSNCIAMVTNLQVGYFSLCNAFYLLLPLRFLLLLLLIFFLMHTLWSKLIFGISGRVEKKLAR